MVSGVVHLSDDLLIIQSDHLKKRSSSLDSYHAEGLEAYRTATPDQLSPSNSKLVGFIPFLSFIALAITLSQDMEFLTLVLDLKILNLVKHIRSDVMRLNTLLPVERLLHALKTKTKDDMPPAQSYIMLTVIQDLQKLQREVVLLTLTCRFGKFLPVHHLVPAYLRIPQYLTTNGLSHMSTHSGLLKR